MSTLLPYPEPRLPVPTYGRNLVEALPAALLESPIVLTQPEPWPLLAPTLAERSQVHLVSSMEHDRVMATTAAFAPASAVVGFGGGAALDHAKYVAWRKGLPLVLVPSILSVDAAYTKTVGVREGSRVRYVGEVYPDHLLVDFSLLRAAPALLNRAGAGDILSIWTALWDWEEAGKRLGEFYDASIARASRGQLARLFDSVDSLARVSTDGLRLLSDLYIGEVRLCEMVGSSRPEEGSEHCLAYCIEAQTGRSFVHGQLISLCVLLAGLVQSRDVSPVADFLARLRLDCSPDAVGLTWDELRTALLRVHDYVKAENHLLPGVFHFEPLNSADIDSLLEQLRVQLAR